MPPCAAGAGPRDRLESALPGSEAVASPGAHVAQEAAWAGEGGSHPQLVASQERGVERIDATMDHAPALFPDPMHNHPLAPTGGKQLPPRHDVVLLRGDRPQVNVHFIGL